MTFLQIKYLAMHLEVRYTLLRDVELRYIGWLIKYHAIISPYCGWLLAKISLDAARALVPLGEHEALFF